MDDDPANERTGPINEYGDCRTDDDLDLVIDRANATTTAQMMMDISDQYYCIGKYYQYELCQSQLALQYYYSAYHTAMQCYRNVSSASTDMAKLDGTPGPRLPHSTDKEESTFMPNGTAEKGNDADVTTFAPSSSSQLLLEEILGQIQLTKECIGRIHFELGNIDEALEML